MNPVLNTRDGRALAVQILTVARDRHLAMTRSEYRNTSRNRYICHAISCTRLDPYHVTAQQHEVSYALRSLIIDRMGRHTALEGWLVKQGHVASFEQCDRLFRKLQRTRLAWINSLIEEFSK
jgi:hypothetical protein